MSLAVGIIGLPNAGKSTLFKVLTKQEVRIEPRPFTTIKPNLGQVEIPDERLSRLASLVGSEKVTPATIGLIDIAGLVRKAHLGEGLGNQFLAQIRNCDALIEVVRAFEDEKVEHLEGSVNPQRDVEIIKTELLMKDFETLASLMAKSPTRVLEEVKKGVAEGKMISELDLDPQQEMAVRELQCLTAKPLLYLFNTGDAGAENIPIEPGSLRVNLKLEEEMGELSEQERQELGITSCLPEVILACYRLLELITFYTIAGGKEARARALRQGSSAVQAAGSVHSDFARRFIRAEVINYHRLLEASSVLEAKKRGWIEVKGKDYLVEDRDVIEFKI